MAPFRVHRQSDVEENATRESLPWTTMGVTNLWGESVLTGMTAVFRRIPNKPFQTVTASSGGDDLNHPSNYCVWLEELRRRS